MSNVIRSLIVKVGADVSQFNQATKAISKDLGKLSKKYDRIGRTLTDNITKPMLAVGAGVGALVVSSLKDAAEAERAIAQLDAVLKSTGQTAGVTREQALELANAFQKTTMFEDETTLAAENMLLTFTKVSKDIFPDALKSTLDMATAMGTDATQAALQLGKTLNDPTRGMTALRRAGVTFSKDQEKQIKILQESGDIMGAQKVILQELQKEFGGSAEAAGKTFAGQLEILKNQFGDVKESLGTALMPVVMDIIQTLQRNMPKIQASIDKFVPIIKNDIIPVLADLGRIVGNVIEWFAELSPETQKTIGKMLLLSAALGPVFSGLSNILGVASNFTGFLSIATKSAGAAGAAGAITKLGASLALLVGPAGWITLAVAGLWALHEAFQAVKNGEIDLTKAYGTKGPRQTWQFGGGATQPTGGGMGDFKSIEKAMTPAPMGEFKQFAKGGIVTRPTLGLIGEAGAEAIIPLGKGITVNHTGTITVRGVNNRGELVAVVEQEITDKLIQDNRRIPNRTGLLPIG
jgi:phage-related minor tail protein